MKNKIVDLSKKLIAIQSDSDRPKELDQALDLLLAQLQDYTIEHFEKDGVKSALIHNAKKGTRQFKIILNGHLDVVRGKDFQYIPQVKGDRLYGVGSLDMKSNLVCLLMAFKAVAKKVDYPLGLQIVTDEEVGGFKGTKYQVDQGVRTEFMIAGETTQLNIAHKAKGIMQVKVHSKGQSAHGAYPWNGKNAIWEMLKFLKNLQSEFPIPKQQQWVSTVNLSKIETDNTAFNKVPDNCTVWLDVRFIPEEANSIAQRIQKIIPKGFALEILFNEPALLVDTDNQYLQLLKKVNQEVTKKTVDLYGAQGTSDARHYSRVGCAGVEFGSVGGGIGSDDEWINISSLEQYYQIIQKFLLAV